jgi:hypothetical protein
MKTIFNSKEQYLAMKAQWAHSSKSIKCKSILLPCDEWLSAAIHGRGGFSKGTGIIRKHGWMQAEHHVLYNLLRNKPSSNGFTTKSSNQVGKPDKFHDALCWLGIVQQQAQAIKPYERDSKWDNKVFRMHVEYTLKPFCDTLTLQQFINLDIPKIVTVRTQEPVLETA